MYLIFDEFKEICPNSTIAKEQFESLESRAETDIDCLTFNRITAKGFDALTDFQRSRVKFAVAMQIEFISNNQELLDCPLSSYSISGVSMSFDKSKVAIIDNVTTTYQVYNTLMQTGLCYRGLS